MSRYRCTFTAAPDFAYALAAQLFPDAAVASLDLSAWTMAVSGGEMVRAALDKNIHVFCEKPFCLDPLEGKALSELAEAKGLVNQVGYHYRFVGAFQRAKRIIESGALGQLHHVFAEAYGPVVLRPKGSTWRTSKSEGGGCLYDYVCHAVDTVNRVRRLRESPRGCCRVTGGVLLWCRVYRAAGRGRDLAQRQPFFL